MKYSILAALIFFLSACGSPSQPTPSPTPFDTRFAILQYDISVVCVYSALTANETNVHDLSIERKEYTKAVIQFNKDRLKLEQEYHTVPPTLFDMAANVLQC